MRPLPLGSRFASSVFHLAKTAKKTLTTIGARKPSPAEVRDAAAKTTRSAVREALQLERQRWATVMRSPHAANFLELASVLLAESNKPAEHVIGRLNQIAASTASSRRAANNPRIDVSGEPSRASAQQQGAASWDRALNVAQGGK